MQYVFWSNPFLASFKIFLIPWFLTFWLWYALVWFCLSFLGFWFCFCFFSSLDMWFYKTDKNWIVIVSNHFYDNPFSFFWDFNYIYITMPNIVPFVTVALIFLCFFPCVSVMIHSIVISKVLFSFTVSPRLLTSSKNLKNFSDIMYF